IAVAADVEIGVAVAVEVGEASATAPGVAQQLGLFGDINKNALGRVLWVGLVMEQGNAAPAGYEQIGPAIAVKIADGTAMRVEPRPVELEHLIGDLPELPVAQVLVQLAGMAEDFAAAVRGAKELFECLSVHGTPAQILIALLKVAAADDQQVEQA